MTQSIRYLVTALSPLAVSERKPGGQFREGWTYIPGALVRGAVAKLLLEKARRDHGCDGFHADTPEQRTSCLFCQVFCTDKAAVFGNAYPAPKRVAPRVLPATVVSCKDYAGFARKCLPDREEEAPCRFIDDPVLHGVFDTLVDRLCWEELAPAATMHSSLCTKYDPANARCSGRVDKFSGFYFIRPSRNERLADARPSFAEWLHAGCKPEGLYCLCKPSVAHRLLTRVAINRRRGVAEDQLLYSPSVLTEGKKEKQGGKIEYKSSQFVGVIQAGDTTAQAICQVLSQVHYLGGGSSRGLGRVKIEMLDKDNQSSMEERIEAFNQVLRERWSLYKELAGIAQHCYDEGHFFVLDLQSDAILKEQGWLPTMVLTADILREATEVADNSLELRRSYTTYGYRGGWQSAWGLPKDVEVTAAMGSCYLFWTADIGRWKEALAELEIRGIGERRTEGFGQVRVCDEIHLVLREVAQ